MASSARLPSAAAACAILACSFFFACAVAYERPPPRVTLDVPLADDADGLTPQQVHISLVGSDKMRITWITDDESPSIVEYGTDLGKNTLSANGSSDKYSYLTYRSGKIHDVVIGPLQPSTVYSYRCGSNPTSDFSFRTPPSSLPFKFAVIGDLGQTGWTKTTLDHLAAAEYDVLLLPGDLSYADLWQPSWDSFGRLVEPLASSRPWMVTQGNHEIEKIPLIHPKPFVAYNARWRMPYDADPATASGSNLFYSFDVASDAVHVVMLGSYADFGPDSDQYKWLAADLSRIDRRRTPWVVVLIHAPWYNSNSAHQGEGEDMRKAMEALLYGARVDIVFAGHVHAYERFDRVYDNKADSCAPVHITIGDGGNKEGLASNYIDPKPDISLFREASFGHGRFEVANETHAHWSWHRNDNDVAVTGDEVWITSHSSNPACAKTN
ncbi:putative purple acid phosphatase 20 [Canna indica]|uniref:Purple acid phosphatase n=1 Tax=Canna indica TaxID=4628 RepID=A0AAQ3Q9S5_9LILI|nr:putative purple acid phosphatase 20 [Canna indica]